MHAMPTSRRHVTTGLLAAPLLMSQAGCRWVQQDRRLELATLEQGLIELARLNAAKALVSRTRWTWAQTLEHCAQSIEHSLSGYPESAPAVFQQTVGRSALAFFRWRGRMSHDLDAPIPGASTLSTTTTVAAATARLQQAIRHFQRWEGPLPPHFAYGALSKAAYAHAHALHLAQHFSAFHPRAAA